MGSLWGPILTPPPKSGCCIYEKPRAFGESSTESDEDEEEEEERRGEEGCGHAHCVRGHKRGRGRRGGAATGGEGPQNPPRGPPGPPAPMEH